MPGLFIGFRDCSLKKTRNPIVMMGFPAIQGEKKIVRAVTLAALLG
jgi:hypothetical protein